MSLETVLGARGTCNICDAVPSLPIIVCHARGCWCTLVRMFANCMWWFWSRPLSRPVPLLAVEQHVCIRVCCQLTNDCVCRLHVVVLEPTPSTPFPHSRPHAGRCCCATCNSYMCNEVVHRPCRTECTHVRDVPYHGSTLNV